MKHQKSNFYRLIAVFSIFIIQFSILNPQDTWIRTYQPFGDDEDYLVEDIRICPDDGYAVIGSIWNELEGNRGFMMKTDRAGNYEWANLDIVDFVSQPEPSGFVVLEDGSFITAGNNFWGTGKYLLKRYPNGEIEWTQSLDNDYSIYAIELTNDGDLITTGSSMDGPVNIQKLDLNGDMIWRGTYLPEGYEVGGGESVTQTSDNGFAITGSVYGENNRDILVIKTDANGDSLWTWTYDGYGGYNDKGSCIISVDHDFLVTGSIYGPNLRSIDTFISKFDNVGDTLWMSIIQDLATSYSVINTHDDNFVGYSWSGSQTNMTRLYKFDEEGDLIWNEQIAHWPAVGDRSIQELQNEGFICAGAGHSGSRIYISKTDSVGQVTSVEDNEINPESILKIKCYPNPVRSSLKISYVLYEPSNVEIDLYNVKGQFIDRILNDNYLIGKHSINRDIINYPSGLYYIHYKTDKQAETKKITIIR